MTQEQKDLLIKDLCARLPYRVRIEYKGKTHSTIYDVLGVAHDRLVICLPFMSHTEHPLVEEVKPYLFPLSSMTEEQKEIYCQLQQKVIYNSKGVVNKDVMNYLNWCYENHLDVNDLIPMDLAIDATGLNIY